MRKISISRLQFTGWIYYRVLKLSLTIADMAGLDDITQVHLAKLLQYR